MGCNRKDAAIFSSNKQMQPMHSTYQRNISFQKQNQASTKEGKAFYRAHTERSICYKTFSGNEKQQDKVGTAIEHTSVILAESGG